MRGRAVIAVVAAFVGFSIFGMPLLARQGVGQGPSFMPRQQQPQPPAQQTETKRIEYYADDISNVPGTDTIIMRKNVWLHHNGAVVVCDSAVRYSDSRFDCFGNVIINKDSTYIYGQRATYDRDRNMARVYDRLVKVVNGTSTLYTYNFAFNTLDNIGRYWGGGTMVQDSNRLESQRGWYHSNTRNVYAAQGVQMTDPEYKLIGDSVRYDMAEEVAEFYTLTHIWNAKGEIMSATKGRYFHKTASYDFTENSYLLTEKQEAWADSMEYHSETKDADFRRNVQIRDDEQQVLAFGDHAVYWGGREEGFLTRNPSLVTFDPEEDSLYMRADTMFLFTLPWGDEAPVATVDEDMEISPMDGFAPPHELPFEMTASEAETKMETANAVGEDAEPQREAMDEMRELSQWHGDDDVAAADSVTVEEKPLTRREQRRLRRQEERAAEKDVLPDSTELQDIFDSLVPVKGPWKGDPNGLPHIKPLDLEAELAVPEPQEPAKHDSLQRIVRAYRDVRMWRSDFQAVCDSLVGFTKDSTMHLHIDPILWHGANQVTADLIDLYTKNKELVRARFTGDPLMVAEVDTARYNQIKGREMESFFRNSEIYYHRVEGNAQTLYYMTDEEAGEPHTFVIVNSTRSMFVIDSQQVVRITWDGNPDDVGYPIGDIPADAVRFLDGFKWEAERRPERSDVFWGRVERPSQRETYNAIPQPSFPLTERIERHKQQMIGQRLWQERYELLPQAAIEWVRRL